MFKQIILPILAVIAFIIIVGIFAQKSSFLGLPGLNMAGPTQPPSKSITIGSKTIQAQIADTPDKRAKGLSGVSSLDADSGMLFVFDMNGVSPLFWMKDMLIPLDFIWVGNGKVVRIDKNIPIPAPNTPDDKLKTYSAEAPIDYILEVNAGFANSNSIKVGDSVSIPVP